MYKRQALTNAGHISYVELDGDPSENLEAFEAVIRHMKESGIGYGSVNHPVDVYKRQMRHLLGAALL